MRPGAMFGPFQVLGQLGQGGMGTVFHARDMRTGQDVALKLLDQEVTPQRAERFRREGETTASLRHPGIVQVLDLGVVDGRPYLAYELITRCMTAAELLPQESVRRRVELLRDAARALGHAHAEGVVHRDVKPDNLLIDANGRIKVADFGLALDAAHDRMTRTGATVGTPYYMSPEQATGRRDLLGPPSDVWSLGVVLYQALAGEVPFQGASMTEVAKAIVAARPRPLREHDPALPRALEAICARALQANPAQRYPHAEALAEALDDYLRGPQAGGSRGGVWLPVGVVAAGALLAVGVLFLAGPGPSDAAGDPRSPAGDSPAGPEAGPPAPSGADSPTGPATASPTRSEPAPAWPSLAHTPGASRVVACWVDAERALTWSAEGVTLWQVETGVPVQRWEDLGPLAAFALREDQPEFLVASGQQITAIGYESLTRQKVTSLILPRGGWSALGMRVWADGASVIVRGSSDHTDVYYRPASDKGQSITRSLGQQRCLAIETLPAPHALLVLTDQGVVSCDASTPNEHVVYEVTQATCLRAARAGARFAVGTADGQVHVCELDRAQPVLSARAGDGSVVAVAFGPSGDLLSAVVAGPPGQPGTWVRWQLGAPATPPQVLPCPGEPTSLAISPRGDRALIGAASGEVWVAPLEAR